MAVTVTFDDGAGGDITLPGPFPGSTMITKKRQALGETAGGVTYSYDKGVTKYEAVLRFDTLSDTQKNTLETFFNTTVTGVNTTWTYTDTGAVEYTARFLDPELPFEKQAKNLWSVSVRLELNKRGE
ncbi:MAG: hypothetical protein JRL30_01145 [Deltaproteobacteria bacterium]|nr:hypothetical protein [Deltaproteobacteria bacterium]